VQTDARVLGTVLFHDFRRAVGAAVERNLKTDVATATNSSVSSERSADPVFLVVCRNHDVETQKDLPRGWGLTTRQKGTQRRQAPRKPDYSVLGVPL
jgi:hypothetical protein